MKTINIILLILMSGLLYSTGNIFILSENSSEIVFELGQRDRSYLPYSANLIIPDKGTVYLSSIEVPENRSLSSADKDEIFTSIKLSKPSILRDFRYVSLTVQPINLSLENIRIRIGFEENTTGANEYIARRRGLSRSFEPLYQSTFINYEAHRNRFPVYQPKQILLIKHHSESIIPTINEFVNWKTDLGYIVSTVSTENLDTPELIKDYIQNAYDSWEIPPEFVVVFGAGTGSLAVPYYTENGIASDHPYSLLSGDDDIPDVFIGRISIDNSYQLGTIWNKIKNYEKYPFVSEIDWYNHSVLVTDVHEAGVSSEFTLRYIKDLMENSTEGFEVSDFYTSDDDEAINIALSQGGSFFLNRRNSYFLTGGFNNGYKLYNSFFMSDGSELASPNAMEYALRLGTPTTARGSVTAVGILRDNTNDEYLDFLSGVYFSGIYDDNLRTMGEVLTKGKIMLQQLYGEINPTEVERHNQITALFGDPSMNIWVDVPKVMTVMHPTTIPFGQNYISVYVCDENQQNLVGALVTLKNTGYTIFESNHTDENGRATLYVPQGISGVLELTISKTGYKTVLSHFEVLTTGSIALDSVCPDNPLTAGETTTLTLGIKSYRNTSHTNVEVLLSSLSPFVQITSEMALIEVIAPHELIENIGEFVVYVSSDAPDGIPVEFNLTISDGINDAWQSSFRLLISGGNLIPVDLSAGLDGNEYLSPGMTESLTITVQNQGQINLSNISGTLSSDNPHIQILQADAYFGDIDIAAVGEGIFTVMASSSLINGMNIESLLSLYNDDGFQQQIKLSLSVGEITVNDPLGPCEYGYYIYDLEDGEDAPIYNWVEIAPDMGGDGINTGLVSDFENIQQTVTIDLPFEFRFYGVEYDRISICANGWVSFDDTELASFRNYSLPGILSPKPIIAAFWDNLSTAGGGVFYRNPIAEDRTFIIQWNNMFNGIENSIQTFQLILYESETPDEDGIIKIQYKLFNNNNANDLYATIGIADHTGTQGLTYTFNNQYPTAAGELSHESAILIKKPVLLLSTDTNNSPLNFTLKQNYPNPFNPLTNISFTLAEEGKVNLAVYNIKGELVKTLLNEELMSGEHTIQWNGINNRNQPVSSGVYFYHLQAGEKRETKKAILLK